ncbi:MAG: PhoPQ-activated protein PqaA family protein [Bacteroidota bacterium]
MKKKNRLNFFRFFLLVMLPVGLISCQSCENTTAPEGVGPETALKSYLENEDSTYSWEVKGSLDLQGVTRHNLILTSQQWREHTWKHALTVLVPDNIEHDGALLFITGGKIENGIPNGPGSDDGFVNAMAQVADLNSAVVAIVWQIPNQPLYDGLVEDELISLTLHNFKNDGDYTWPLLFPMVKGAIRAMDAVQEFTGENYSNEITRFVLSGASKRGWTTWLTGASDTRAEAIAPAVIDVLNMPVSLDYQVKVWGDYSVEIQDYVDLGIPQDVHTPGGNDITLMVDPYSYRDKLTMPKMILLGTNDPYWPVDAIRHYLDGIPGENYINYVPNAGHGLGSGEQALFTLSAFFGHTLLKQPYPLCKWSVAENETGITLSVEATAEKLLGAKLWIADSQDRDFRNEYWTATSIDAAGQNLVKVDVELPESGHKAFYLDLEYPSPSGGNYTKSTRMFVADSTGIHDD